MKNRRKPALLKYDSSHVFNSASASSSKSPSSFSALRISRRNLSRFADEYAPFANSAGTEKSTGWLPLVPSFTDNSVAGSVRKAQPPSARNDASQRRRIVIGGSSPSSSPACARHSK